jgi:hypothetical protein
MTSIKQKIKILSISDIHVGHAKAKAEYMLSDIVEHVIPKVTEDLDIFFIGGDFFDRLLNMDGTAGYHAVTIISEIRRACIANGVLLRILRGTFSHDYNQNQFFIVDDDPYINGVQQVRLFDNISIEHIPFLDVNILYVPDDLPYADAMPIIEDKVKEHQLNKVDIAVTHSYYEHLIPPNIPHRPHNTYSADRFAKIVKGPIFNGHIHTTCVYKSVITNGSFGRLCHNEEEAKGFYLVEYDKVSLKVRYEFVENTSATVFKTIDLTTIPKDDQVEHYIGRLKRILESANSSNPTIHVRIISESGVAHQLIEYTRERYNNVSLSHKSTKDDYKESASEIHVELVDLPIITESNLPAMVIDHLNSLGKITSLTESEIVNMLVP